MKYKFVTVIGSVAVTCASLFVISSGVANADGVPNVIGKQWGEAKGMLYQANLTPVIATVVGDRVEQAYCRVVSTSKLTSRDSSGRPTSNQVQVNLSCYDKPASGRAPGISAGNNDPAAEAVRAEDAASTRKWKQSPNGQQWCAETYAPHPDWAPDPDCQLAAE